jgi:hypothetical protein
MQKKVRRRLVRAAARTFKVTAKIRNFLRHETQRVTAFALNCIRVRDLFLPEDAGSPSPLLQGCVRQNNGG